MAGIVSYGSYVPLHRLGRVTIAEALGTRGGHGERSVAGYDEDTVTMAVEAARDALAATGSHERGAQAIATLAFATTEPPYQEKLNSATAHAALRLPAAVQCMDVGCSNRAGLGSLIAAARGAGGGLAPGGAEAALVAAADIRVSAPEGARERDGGDAAAAFLVGGDAGIAEIETAYSETLEFLSTWRLPGRLYPNQWEERFALTQAYVPLGVRAARALVERSGCRPGEIDRVVFDCPNPKAARLVAAQLGLEPQQVVGDLSAKIGHSGTAHALLLLAHVLDQASPGDRIAVISVSDGVDAVLLRATDAIAGFAPHRTVEQLLDSKRTGLAYTRYLRWRGILDSEPPRRPDPEHPAAPPSLRAEHWKFGFVASKCNECGTCHLPPQVVCVHCGATGKMSEEPFADRRAVVRTFAVDRLAFTPQPPMVVAMIDFEGGGRFQSELTDCDPEAVKIGDEVEMTFRRLFTAKDVHNYFWKGRPRRT